MYICIISLYIYIYTHFNNRHFRIRLNKAKLTPVSTPQLADSHNLCRTNETSVVEMVVFPPYELLVGPVKTVKMCPAECAVFLFEAMLKELCLF